MKAESEVDNIIDYSSPTSRPNDFFLIGRHYIKNKIDFFLFQNGLNKRYSSPMFIFFFRFLFFFLFFEIDKVTESLIDHKLFFFFKY